MICMDCWSNQTSRNRHNTCQVHRGEFYADEVEVTATDQEVENDNIMVTRSSYNAIIVHGTFHNDGIEGTASPQLAAAADDDDIKEVDMPENEPAEIIDVSDDDATYEEQEDPTDENPGDNLSQNQDGVSNTADVTAATDSKDTTKDRSDGDNLEGNIKVEDVYNDKMEMAVMMMPITSW